MRLELAALTGEREGDRHGREEGALQRVAGLTPDVELKRRLCPEGQVLEAPVQGSTPYPGCQARPCEKETGRSFDVVAVSIARRSGRS
jgi:hypothetical protein